MNEEDISSNEEKFRDFRDLMAEIEEGSGWVRQKRQEMPDYQEEYYKTCDYRAVCEEERCLIPVPEFLHDVVDVVVDKVVRALHDGDLPDEFISLVDWWGRGCAKGEDYRYLNYTGENLGFTDECLSAVNMYKTGKLLLRGSIEAMRDIALELLTRGCEAAAANALNVHMAMRRMFTQEKKEEAYVEKKTKEWDDYWWQVWRLEHSQGETGTNTDNPEKQQ